MQMTGCWHLYRPGERWRKPGRLAKVVLHTDEFVAPCFNAPVVELLTPRQVERHPRYKSEVLFSQRVSPFTPVGELAEERLRAILAEAHRLLRLNPGGGVRRTLPGLDRRQRLWVYGRSGAPCRVCGDRIRFRRQGEPAGGPGARSTYYSPNCQRS